MLRLYLTSEDHSRLGLGVRTVSGREAIARLRQLDANSTISVEAAEVVLAYRDNIAHIGLSAPAVEPISPFANLVLVVEDLLRLDPEVFWGTHHEFVRAAVDDLVCRRWTKCSEECPIPVRLRSETPFRESPTTRVRWWEFATEGF